MINLQIAIPRALTPKPDISAHAQCAGETIMIEELTTTHTCPNCESPLDELGAYGSRAHFACPNCDTFMSVSVWRRIETKEDEE